VGYNTGHINFPGDVLIGGEVTDGFKLQAGGSITIKQTLDVTDVMARGDLVVAGGIVGRAPAIVKVGGNIKTKFIENCRVACRKSVGVSTSIARSSIFTLGSLVMGEKSQIIGSEIYAVHGIKAGNIGRSSGKASVLHCGIDFSIQQEKDRCNEQLRIVAAKLAKLRDMMAAPEFEARSDDEKKKAAQAMASLQAEQEQLALKVTDLMGKVNADENAVVEVSGEIAPDTLIEICQVSLYVTAPLKKVRIRLDKAHDRLLTAEG
jgi:uncharacterized protein (DUF342 family)